MRLCPLLPALAMSASTAVAQGGAYALQPAERQMLDIHNRERAAVGAPALRWNVQLASDAAEHAQQLARTGSLVHAPRQGRGIARENLSQGPLGWGPDQFIRQWLDEKRVFHGGIYPDVCTGGWSNCAHYTQVIWPGTTDLGCGMTAGRGAAWFVCRYSPGGNKDGTALRQVVSRTHDAARGPAGSATSRQLLGTPSQASKRSNLEILCEASGEELRSLGIKLEQLKAQRAVLRAEMVRVENAIGAEQAGLTDYDPSLLERIMGTATAPSKEKMIALSRELAKLRAEWQANEAETKAILDKLQKIQSGSGLCGSRERENQTEERGRN